MLQGFLGSNWQSGKHPDAWQMITRQVAPPTVAVTLLMASAAASCCLGNAFGTILLSASHHSTEHGDC